MSERHSMIGKTCLVTGASSGIGKETALGLARAGADVTLLCRDEGRGRSVLEEITAATGSSRVDLVTADLSSQSSIRKAAQQFALRHGRLDVLINNAAVLLTERRDSVDGIELTTATNYLGPFLLTHSLLPLLRESAPSRVVNVTSQLHHRALLDLNDPEGRCAPHRFLASYARSKLLLTLFSYELARRLRRTGISVVSVQPGVAFTNLGADNPLPGLHLLRALCRPFLPSARDGAQSVIALATAPEVAYASGRHFVGSRPAAPSPLSLDPGVADAIWRWSEQKVGLSRAAMVPHHGYRPALPSLPCMAATA